MSLVIETYLTIHEAIKADMNHEIYPRLLNASKFQTPDPSKQEALALEGYKAYTKLEKAVEEFLQTMQEGVLEKIMKSRLTIINYENKYGKKI